MKIAWVTPYNTRSAIGRFSRLVAEKVSSDGHAITIVRSEAAAELLDGSDVLPGTDVVRWDEACYDPDFWSSCDAVVHNIGDNYLFHAGGIELLQRFPGVVIVHDFFLLGLFRGWCAATGNRALGDRILDDLYGEATALRLRTMDGGPGLLEYACEHFPMTEWIGRLAHGAVAHSSFYADRLRRSCGGPVAVIPLAYNAPSAFQPLAGRPQSSDVTVLTVGPLDQNKRVELVIRALGSSDVLRERCRYHVVGLVADQERDRLRAVAREMSFENVQITGEVSDQILRAEIEAADMLCSLGWPVSEGGPASAVEAMLSGRPVIVSDGGFDRDLPDDLVFKVDPTRELSALTSQLTRLVLDPALRVAVGAQAAAWAKAAFSVDAYVARLVPLIEGVAKLRPTLGTAAHFGHLFSDLGLLPNDPAVERVATILEDLFIKNIDAKSRRSRD